MTTWTPVARPAGAWTAEAAEALRVFDPYVFDRAPIFDTGSSQGIWNPAGAPASNWTNEQ